jgi:hypothetical protein
LPDASYGAARPPRPLACAAKAQRRALARKDTVMTAKKKKKAGLYANLHAKQERIQHGSGEHMRKPGSPGAPSEEDFEKAGKTAHKRTPRH